MASWLETVPGKERGETMVTLTDKAAQVLRATLAQLQAVPGQTFRLVLRPGVASASAWISSELAM